MGLLGEPYRVLHPGPWRLYSRILDAPGLVQAVHIDVAMPANQAELRSSTNLLTADGADVTVSLLALGLGLGLRHNASKANAQVNTGLGELSFEDVGRRGMRVAVGAIILDGQVAAFALGLEGLVVIAAVLAGGRRSRSQRRRDVPSHAAVSRRCFPSGG